MAYDYKSIEHKLRIAARDGDKESVVALLEHGVQINAATPSGMTAYRLAWKYQHLEIARLLLRSGASVFLDDARTLEELHFLKECGVKQPTLGDIDARVVLRYENGQISRNDMEIALGRRRDPTLTMQTTIEDVETEGVFRHGNSRWEILKECMQTGDELWKFDKGKWDQFAGRMGYVLFRQGRLIIRIVTFLN